MVKLEIKFSPPNTHTQTDPPSQSPFRDFQAIELFQIIPVLVQEKSRIMTLDFTVQVAQYLPFLNVFYPVGYYYMTQGFFCELKCGQGAW